MMNETHFYVDNPEEWLEKNDVIEVSSEPLRVHCYGNAIILPAKMTGTKLKILLAGGVCDANFNFLAGQTRSLITPLVNHSCLQSYIPPRRRIQKSDQTVIFGGILDPHFGHFLINSLSRWWYVLSEDCQQYPIVFITYESDPNPFLSFFSNLGVSNERIVLLTKATQFRRVIVPDEAVRDIEGWANIGWSETFQKISCPPESPSAKLYLTRTKLTDSEEVNEKFLEDFYADQGYEIVSPETLSFADQIEVVSRASHIACTLGTLSHLVLFARDGINIDIYLRNCNEILVAQLLINKIKNLHANIIDATKNILPTTHSLGVYLYYPSENFLDFVEENNLNYKIPDEKEYLNSFLYEYLCRYAKRYSTLYFYKRMRSTTFYDIINSIHIKLFGERINVPARKNIRYADEYVRLKRRARFLRHHKIEYVEEVERLNSDRLDLWQALQKRRKSPLVYFPCFDVEGMQLEVSNKHRIVACSPLIALRVFSEVEILYELFYRSCGWVTLSSAELDEDNPMPLAEQVLALRMKIVEDDRRHIYYRLFRAGRWSDFCHDGQICGDVNCKNFVPCCGIQIGLCNARTWPMRIFF